MSQSDAVNRGIPSPADLESGRLRYQAVQERIRAAAERAGRSLDDITLVGVAKRQPIERILSAIAAGVRVLGQSYIQEAREIRPAIESALALDPTLSRHPLEWRMVGLLQRNKAGLAARLFDAIETVDRPKLIETLARRATEEGRPLDVLIQVSLCGESQKGGCESAMLSTLAEQVLAAPGLNLRGLMTIPAASPDPEDARPVFRALRELRPVLARLDTNLSVADLSMGMSGDLEVAVEEGATLVRVGTALFGTRVDSDTK